MTSVRRLGGTVGSIAVVAIALASCAINAEGIPRDIPQRDRSDLNADSEQAAGAATGSGRIYLLSPEVTGQPRTLRSVARDIGNTPADALNALFKGPNNEELQALMRSAIPTGTRLLDVTHDGVGGESLRPRFEAVDLRDQRLELADDALVARAEDALGEPSDVLAELPQLVGDRIPIHCLDHVGARSSAVPEVRRAPI